MYFTEKTKCTYQGLILFAIFLLNPLTSPRWRLEGICKILRFVHDLSIAEFHNTDSVCRMPLVSDNIFRDPELTFSENSPDIEARWFTGMMTPQRLQIVSSKDSLARLRIITDDIIVINIMFHVYI